MKHNNRHLKALLLSTTIYGMAIGSIVGFDFDKKLPNELKNDKETSVKIALISSNIPLPIPQESIKTQEKNLVQNSPMQPPIEQKQIIEQKVVNESSVKEIPKIIEPKPIQTTPQISQTIPKVEQKVEQKVLPPQIVESSKIAQKVEQKPQYVTQAVVHNTPKVIKSETNNDEIKEKKRAYFQLVKNTIEKHKYYPQNALRRGIECDMKVRFTISQMGELLSLDFIDGNRVFHNSVKEAIESSFPLLPPKNILAENETLSLVISYTIN